MMAACLAALTRPLNVHLGLVPKDLRNTGSSIPRTLRPKAQTREPAYAEQSSLL